MQKVKLESIVVTSNPRQEFDVDDLVRSIKLTGIIQPLLVQKTHDGKLELIDGGRRFRAAKKAGLTEVPVDIMPAADKCIREELRLIANLQRKDLTLLEEAKGFKDYMKRYNASAQQLACSISKKTMYVEKRLQLLGLSDQLKAAVNAKKMRLGHALALLRVKDERKKRELTASILRGEMTVSDTLDSIRRSSPELKEAIFDIKHGPNGIGEGNSGCSGCPQNGGEQSMLFETGSTLKGNCLKPVCFHKKTREYIEMQTKDLKQRGVTVLSEAQYNQLQRYTPVSSHDSDFKDVAEKRLLEEPKHFAVVFKTRYGNEIEKQIICTAPASRHRKVVKTKDGKVVKRSFLKARIKEYRANFLKAFGIGLIQPDTQNREAIVLYALADSAPGMITREILKGTGISKEYSPTSMKAILRLPKKKIVVLIDRLSSTWVNQLHDPNLSEFARATKVNYKRHFKINEVFLKLHTKAEMLALAKELGITIPKTAKKAAEVRGILLAANTRGKVPKVLEKI